MSTHTKAHVANTVQANFRALEAACDATSGDASRLLWRLLEVAEKQERAHLAFGRSLLGRNPQRQQTIKLTAMYFACKCAAEDYSHLSAANALAYLGGLREDYQIGAMLGAVLREQGHPFAPTVAFGQLDYCSHFAVKE